MALSELHDALREHEQSHGPTGLRIVRVYHPDPPERIWHGLYGSAEHVAGEPGYQLSSGERIAL